jgi:hypothetical protein
MISFICKCAIPIHTLLERYARDGGYTDCYRTEVPGRVSLREYIPAFYTTPLFKLERLILMLAVKKPSTDAQAEELANGRRDQFAAWHVEGRTEEEILMCDLHGRTRSWLMVLPSNLADGSHTKLYFGSAIVPKLHPQTGSLSLGAGYRALLGFHQVYSVLLLYSVRLRLLNKSQKYQPVAKGD